MTAWLAQREPQRLRSAILGGIGMGLIEGGGPGENVAEALEAPSLEDVTDPVGRTFRAFADQTRSDRRALAACLRGSRRLMTRDEAAGITVPVLIAVGTTDEIAGSAAGARKDHSGVAGARHSQPRPHARGRRQGLQDRRAGISVPSPVMPPALDFPEFPTTLSRRLHGGELRLVSKKMCCFNVLARIRC